MIGGGDKDAALQFVRTYLRDPEFLPYPDEHKTSVEAMADATVQIAKNLFRDCGSVPLTSMIYGDRDVRGDSSNPVCAVLTARGDSEAHKEILSRATYAIGSLIGGWGTAFVSEAWMVHTDNKEALEEWQKANGSLQGHPDCKERLAVIIDHPRGQRFYRADIVNHEEGSRTLDDFVHESKMDRSEGRFTRMLLDKQNGN